MDTLQAIGIQRWRVRGRIPVPTEQAADALNENAEDYAASVMVPTQAINSADASDNKAPVAVAPSVQQSRVEPSYLPEPSQPVVSSDSSLTDAAEAGSASIEAAVNRQSDSASAPTKITPAPKSTSKDSGSPTIPALRPAPVPLETTPTMDLTISEDSHSAPIDGDSGEPLPHPAPFIDYTDDDIPAPDEDDVYDSIPPIQMHEVESPSAPDLGSISDLDWRALQARIDTDHYCQSCGSERSVLGYGDVLADWVFITDAPTSGELAEQKLHAQRAGQLYEAILHACGLSRDNVYSTSIFKCVAPEDLSLSPQCDKLIHRQLELIQPKVVVAFGELSAQTVLRSNASLNELMQRAHQYQSKNQSGCTVVAASTPQQLLAQPLLKAELWRSLKPLIAQLRG